MKTLLVTNIKGGVAKSTTAVAIAAGIKIAKPDAKILLIDGDPQGSIKTYFGLKIGLQGDFGTFLIDDSPFEHATQAIRMRDVGEVDVMVSSRRLSEADLRMAAFPRREETLKMRFKKQNISYDYCIIDSSPSMNLVLLNFMLFADNWLIPATMDAFAVSNIVYLCEQRKIVEEFYERVPKIVGILPTMYDRRTTVAKNALEAITTRFGKDIPVLDPIPVDSTVKKAQVRRQMVYDFLPESRAASAYKLASEALIKVL